MMTNQSRGLTFWLLAGLGLFGCGRSTLTVNVIGWAPGDGALQVRARVDGQPVMPLDIPAQQSQFTVRFNQGPAAAVLLDGFVSGEQGCFVATGSSAAQFHGELETLSADLKLVHFQSPQCESAGCGRDQWCQQQPAAAAGIDLQAVWADDENAWAVGYGGNILHWTPATDWQRVTSATVDTLNAVWGSGASDLWAVGLYGTVLAFDGTAWSKVANTGVGTSTLNAVTGLGLGEIWIGGVAVPSTANNLSVFRAEGAKVRQSWAPLKADFDVNSIWEVAGGAWVTGAQGNLQLLASPASSIRIQPTMSTLHGLWGAGTELASDLWAVGDSGTLCAGQMASWSCSQQGTASLYSVAGSAARGQLWAVGAEGTIFGKSGSAPWQRADSKTTQLLNSVFVAPGGRVWVVGNNGTILRYN